MNCMLMLIGYQSNGRNWTILQLTGRDLRGLGHVRVPANERAGRGEQAVSDHCCTSVIISKFNSRCDNNISDIEHAQGRYRKEWLFCIMGRSEQAVPDHSRS